MTASLDRRITPFRTDLAAEHLRGQVEAERYVPGVRRRVRAASTPLKRQPHPQGPLETEALAGEIFTLYEEDGEGWGWGQIETDGYVGWLALNALGDPEPAPTHRVAVLRTFVYPDLSIKAEPLTALSLGAQVHVIRIDGAFAVTPGGAIHAGHLAPLGSTVADFVATAEQFTGVPYLWGGKTSLGIDCSGLAQVALASAGITAPRDSDMQEAALGVLLGNDVADLKRGDLVFWKGHVGIMQDGQRLLHANGHHMMVVSEPLAEARARILAKSYGPVTSIRRLD